jgi:hypothetical protein
MPTQFVASLGVNSLSMAAASKSPYINNLFVYDISDIESYCLWVQVLKRSVVRTQICCVSRFLITLANLR